jgi:lysophospholipase L1-like esterase
MIISLPFVNEFANEDSRQKYKGATKKFVRVNEFYKKIANKKKCLFVDAGKLKPGPDGVHMKKESHIELARLVYKEIKKIKT